MLIGTVVVCLGILLGYLARVPETAELLLSIAVISVEALIAFGSPLNGMLVWLFFTPVSDTWIAIPMGAGIPDLSLPRFTVAFLMIVMLARAAIGKFRFARIGLVEVWIVATTLGIMACAPLSASPKNVLQKAISMYFVPLSLYFFAKNLVRNRDDLHRLFLVMALFGTVTTFYAIYENATGNMLLLGKGESLAWNEARAENYGYGLRQVRGILSAHHFGRVLLTTIPGTFYLFFESKRTQRKAWLAGMIVVQFYGMFLSLNRGSWYSLLISLFILQFFYPQFRKVYLVIVLVTAVLLWATWDQFTESTVVTKRVQSESSTYEGRQELWEVGYSMWRVKPVRGWGFSRFRTESGRFRTDGSSKNHRSVENDYLHILVASGLIGFTPYLLFMLTPLVNGVRLYFKARAPGWSGFIKPETIAVYGAIILAFAIASYTQTQVEPMVRMLPSAVAGAIVGSHEHWLRRSEGKRRSAANSLPSAVAAREGEL
jgi:O-antigen ligase